ncbi:hypothetical protein BGZ99_008621 [Dissophora globulifera]|uniref:Uncharacterized protein n=1 Tax=Dissophora globulifera TaxID=979702 RepID=A0A9P6RR58_9FUNG|nr:hypothetical protein BGZ99_008621 [Dissophora globulifera]
MSSPVNQSDTLASAASAEDSSPPVLDTSDATAPSTSQPTISTPIRFQTPEPDDDDDDEDEDDDEDDDDQDDSDDYSDDFSDQNAADDLSESEASSNGDILTAPNADEQDGDRPLITLQVDPATGLRVAMPALPARDNRARVSLLANRLRRQHRRMTSSIRPGGLTQRRTARFSESGSAFTPADLPSPSSSSSSISKRPIPVMDEKTQSDLRKKIMEIQRDSSILPAKKALMIQELMAPPRTGSRKTTQQPSTDGSNSITEDDLETTYYDKELGVLGCQHYQRSCKLQANCCGGWFNCRFCHDDACDHEIVRSETKNMLCMRCKTVQPAAQSCSSCSTTLARYYCDICKLWDDQPDKSIYHCDDCGICRIGNGLGQDFFHCQKCNVCMHIDLKDNHKCIEGNLERDCPVCGEFLFTSKITVVFMVKDEYSVHI